MSAASPPAGQQAEPTDEQIMEAIRHLAAEGGRWPSDWLAACRVAIALARHPSERPAPAGQAVGARVSVLDVPAYANERAQAEMLEALKDATAHLAGAASAYRTYAKRSSHLGKVPADALFTTRADDFDKAAGRARAALAASQAERPSIKESSTTEDGREGNG